MTKIPKLFELMISRGINAKKVSDATGISTGNISDWKSGRSVPSLDKIKQLADYFNVSIDYLLGNEQNEKSPLSEEDRELLDVFSQLGKTRRKDYLDLIRGELKK
ncbi:MAG: helix-turn-helix transcriptional regulator [Oscillospiraceae bacterium]